MIGVFVGFSCIPLNAELNPTCHLLALLEGATIVVVSRLRVNILQFSFALPYIGPRILLYTSLSKMFNCFLSVFVSIQVSDVYVNVLCIIVFFSINYSFFWICFASVGEN